MPDGDRPPGYVPPDWYLQQRSEEKWRKPSLGEILTDLGLRLVEVGVVAVVRAAAEEIAYFFSSRRFLPEHLYPKRKRRGGE